MSDQGTPEVHTSQEGLHERAASEAIRIALKGAEPTDEQWEAISQPLQPLHLVAAAGSGKTAVMAARIVWIIERQGFSPSQVLGLTFTNKAAEELRQRVRAAVAEIPGVRPEEITVQTYHAFAAGVVREHGLLVGVEPEAGLLSEAQQWQIVLACLDDVPPFEAIDLRSSAALVRAALALATSLSDHMVAISDVEAAAERVLASLQATDEMQEAAAKRKELCRVVEAYARAKRNLQRIDFGDQVSKAVEILESHTDVRDAYRARFPVVLLDEYQDTNVAQRRMLQALIGKGGAVTAVGDARQAIYAFRGATMYNLLEFPSHFPRAGDGSYGELSISDNFRSGRRILDVANRVVEPIPEPRRPGKRLRPAKARDGRPRKGDGRVLLGLFEDERAEAQWIAERCDALHGQAPQPGGKRLAWRDMAILVRRKAAMGALLDALEERDIPVEVIGLGGLLKTPEVTEIVSWLRALEIKPSANRWLARVLLGPRWRIHYRDLALCARWVFNRNYDYRLKLAAGDEDLAREMEPGDVGFALAEALDHVDEIEGLGPEARRRLKAFAQRLQALRAQIHEPLLDLVQEVIRASGIADALESSASRVAAAGKQNVANFLDQVAAFAPVEGESTLRSFLAYLDAAEDAEETLEATQPAEHDSVKLMTVHAAKGLEFECVFVPSMAAGRTKSGDYNALTSIFPNLRTSDPLRSYEVLPYEVREDADNWPKWEGDLERFKKEVRERTLEDERRLFYVALTRAKQQLSVTAAWWYGRDRGQRGPSQFWDELREAAGDQIELILEAEPPEVNPAVQALGDAARWPPVARVGGEDPLFHDGWAGAADEVVSGRVELDDLLRLLDEDQQAEFARLSAVHEAELDGIAAARREEPGPRLEVPDALSATQHVALERGEIGAWDLVRPLPERPAPSRRLGTEIHRLIEERHRGVALYPEESELDEPAEVADAGRISELLSRWNELGYADRKLARLPSGEPMLELPFTLRRHGRIIRGRIDAVYETDDGGIEIVDFKTGGRAPVEGGAAGEDQLALYAAALEANGLLPEGKPVVLTYAYLDGGPPSSRRWRSVPRGGDGGYPGTSAS